MTHQSPSEIIEALHGFSDALMAAHEALAKIPYGQRFEVDALLDLSLFPADLNFVARKLTELADAWTDELPGDGEATAQSLTQEAA